MNSENLSTLKIHKFKTQDQYEAATAQGLVAETDMCLVPDVDEYGWIIEKIKKDGLETTTITAETGEFAHVIKIGNTEFTEAQLIKILNFVETLEQ